MEIYFIVPFFLILVTSLLISRWHRANKNDDFNTEFQFVRTAPLNVEKYQNEEEDYSIYIVKISREKSVMIYEKNEATIVEVFPESKSDVILKKVRNNYINSDYEN